MDRHNEPLFKYKKVCLSYSDQKYYGLLAMPSKECEKAKQALPGEYVNRITKLKKYLLNLQNL